MRPAEERRPAGRGARAFDTSAAGAQGEGAVIWAGRRARRARARRPPACAPHPPPGSSGRRAARPASRPRASRRPPLRTSRSQGRPLLGTPLFRRAARRLQLTSEPSASWARRRRRGCTARKMSERERRGPVRAGALRAVLLDRRASPAPNLFQNHSKKNSTNSRASGIGAENDRV